MSFETWIRLGGFPATDSMKRLKKRRAEQSIEPANLVTDPTIKRSIVAYKLCQGSSAVWLEGLGKLSIVDPFASLLYFLCSWSLSLASLKRSQWLCPLPL